MVRLSCAAAPSLGAMKADCPFFQYLRNRTTEFDKAGKEWKFALIGALWESLRQAGLQINTADEQEIRATLQSMVQQGPFYMPPRVEEPQTLEG